MKQSLLSISLMIASMSCLAYEEANNELYAPDNTYVSHDDADEKQQIRKAKYKLYAESILEMAGMSDDYIILPKNLNEMSADIYSKSFKPQDIQVKIFATHKTRNTACEISTPSWMNYVSVNCLVNDQWVRTRYQVENGHEDFQEILNPTDS